MIQDFLGAVGLLTRLPVSGRWGARGAWAWPVVGALIGAVTGGVWFDLRWLGATPTVAAWLALGIGLLGTGCLHEDGLADVADGFGGGFTRARKLEIMRDSRIGSYGVVALVVAIGLRVAALSAIAAPQAGWLALVVAGAAGRGAMCLPLLITRPARPDGLGAGLGTASRMACIAGLLLGALPAALLVPPRAALLVIAASLLAALAITELARRQIGGHSGDVFGAVAVLAETAALVALSVRSA